MPFGFLRLLIVVARGVAFLFRRALVRGDIAEALGDRALMDFGGPLVRDRGVVVALHSAAVSLLVTLVGRLGALGGAPHVVRGDGLARGEFLPRRSSSSARRAAAFPAASPIRGH